MNEERKRSVWLRRKRKKKGMRLKREKEKRHEKEERKSKKGVENLNFDKSGDRERWGKMEEGYMFKTTING